MLTAVFSDVHGNLPALERFVERTRACADAYVCLGDVVNYGPWNDECLELVSALPRIVLLEGNHERFFLGTGSLAQALPLVREFFERSSASFSRFDLIARLPQEHELGPYLCVHTIDGKRIYADTPLAVSRDYMIGHTHHQFRIERTGHTIINCGSIGQDRQQLGVLKYLLHDSTTQPVQLSQETYPAVRLLQEMAARGYSERCLDYYRRLGAAAPKCGDAA